MDEVDLLLQATIQTTSAKRWRYQDVFAFYLDIDVMQVSDDELKQLARQHITGIDECWITNRDDCLEFIMSHVIEPQLAELTTPIFIYDFPASQAQLAKVSHDQNGNSVAKRFELYVRGMELANGYDELLDADELRQRFEKDNRVREQQNKSIMPIDKRLLAAMEFGLPQCTGVALGLDRLVMMVTEHHHIQDVQGIYFDNN
jgi:lysyl-tRNA synthetase class 2